MIEFHLVAGQCWQESGWLTRSSYDFQCFPRTIQEGQCGLWSPVLRVLPTLTHYYPSFACTLFVFFATPVFRCFSLLTCVILLHVSSGSVFFHVALKSLILCMFFFGSMDLCSKLCRTKLTKSRALRPRMRPKQSQVSEILFEVWCRKHLHRHLCHRVWGLPRPPSPEELDAKVEPVDMETLQ